MITELVQVHCGSICGAENHQFHMHPYHQLDIVLEGEVVYQLEDEEQRVVRADSCVMIPPLFYHRLNTRQATTHLALKCYVTSHFAEALGNHPIVMNPNSGVCAYLPKALHRYANDSPFAINNLIAVGGIILAEMIDEQPALPPRHSELQSFRQALLPVLYRANGVPFDTSVADMAKACHMSTDHFSRQFQQLLYISPRQFLQETRFRIAARDLMSQPVMTMEAIAERAGYGSVTAFGRAFRQYFQMSPKAFREGKPLDQSGFDPLFRHDT